LEQAFFSHRRLGQGEKSDFKVQGRERIDLESLMKIEKAKRISAWMQRDSQTALLRCQRRAFIFSGQKNPASEERSGFPRLQFFTAFHRRLVVKRIKAGILAFGSSYSGRDRFRHPSSFRFYRPPCPFPSRRESGYGKFRPRLQRRGRPRFSRGSLSTLSHPDADHLFLSSYHSIDQDVNLNSVPLVMRHSSGDSREIDRGARKIL